MLYFPPMRRFLLMFGFLLPLSAAALEYRNNSLLYTDAPFAPADAAGISLLTEVGAVSGNPDGTFRPNRTLNRAEFLKIVLESHPRIAVSTSDAATCFPDVLQEAWFSKYVCLAKRREIVEGYPDGNFRPENPVNYAEALKILGVLYKYTAYAEPDAPWYQIYVQAAINNKTILPINLAYDASITRGQMTRLAAAYLANNEGELELYRETERGNFAVSSSESSSSSSSIVSSSESSEESSSSSSQITAEAPDLPATSQLIMLGERSKAIADGTFLSTVGDVRVRIVEIVLDREVRSIESLFLLDEDGVQVAELSLDRFDPDDETWRVDIAEEDAYLLSDREEKTFVIETSLQGRGSGGLPGELFKVKSFRLTAQDTSGATVNLVPGNAHYPSHQTVQARMSSIQNAGDESGTLQDGNNKTLSSFKFSGELLDGAQLNLNHLVFTMKGSGSISVSGWELGIDSSPSRHSCSVEASTTINCLNLPPEMSTIDDGEQIIHLYGDVDISGVGGLRISLVDPGTVGINGAVRWSDGTGDYTWVDKEAPVAEGTSWWSDNN